MSKSKLKFISTDKDREGLFIETFKDSTPALSYKDSDGKLVRTSLNNKNRGISCLELVHFLRNHNWLIHKKLYIEEGFNGDFSVKIQTGNNINTSPIYKKERSDDDLTITSDTGLKDSVENMIATSELYLFDNSMGRVDFLSTHKTINLIEYNSDVYTDNIDIKKILSGINCKSGEISSKIDLSIQYTKKIDNEVSLFNYNTSFEGFKIIDEKVEFKNFTENHDNFDIEYFNGIVKVYPKSNVIECIISNCIATYGNL